MTDAEIIKIVKLCCEYNPQCAICPLNEYDTCDQCMGKLLEGCLDLINRQQAEIERLNRITDDLVKIADTRKKANFSLLKEKILLTRELKSAKAEAIKEFVERLKENAHTVDDDYSPNGEITYVEVDDIDNLIKEMVGEK